MKDYGSATIGRDPVYSMERNPCAPPSRVLLTISVELPMFFPQSATTSKKNYDLIPKIFKKDL